MACIRSLDLEGLLKGLQYDMSSPVELIVCDHMRLEACVQQGPDAQVVLLRIVTYHRKAGVVEDGPHIEHHVRLA